MTQSLFTTNSFISPVKNKIIPRRTKSNYKINFPPKLPISIKYPKSSPRIKIKNNRLKQNVIKVKRKKLFEPEIKNTQINKNKNIKLNKTNINIILSEKSLRRHKYSNNIEQKNIVKYKEMKKYGKLLIVKIKYVQIWWKTIFQIIKIQKNIRGFLFRSKLLETLETKEKYADNLIRLMKSVKTILFDKFIFKVFCQINTKYFFNKWREITTKKKIIENILSKLSPRSLSNITEIKPQIDNFIEYDSLINLNNNIKKNETNLNEFKNSELKSKKCKNQNKNYLREINHINPYSPKKLLLNKMKKDNIKSFNLLNKKISKSKGKLKVNTVQNNKIKNTIKKQTDNNFKYYNTANNFKSSKSFVNNKIFKNNKNDVNKNPHFKFQYNNKNTSNYIIMNNINKLLKSIRMNTNSDSDDNNFETERIIYDKTKSICSLKNIFSSQSKIYENQLNQKTSDKKTKPKKIIKKSLTINGNKLKIKNNLRKYFHLWVKKTIIYLFLDMLHIINNIFKFNRKLRLLYLKKYYYLFKIKLEEKKKSILLKYFNKYKKNVFKGKATKNIFEIYQNNAIKKRSTIKDVLYRKKGLLNNNKFYQNYYNQYPTIKIKNNNSNIKINSSERQLGKLNYNINDDFSIRKERGVIISKIIELPILKIKLMNNILKKKIHNNSMSDIKYGDFLKHPDDNPTIITERIITSPLIERFKYNIKSDDKKRHFSLKKNLNTQKNKLIIAIDIIEKKRILQMNEIIFKFLKLWKNFSKNRKNYDNNENYKIRDITPKNTEVDAITLSNDFFQQESELGVTKTEKNISLLKNNVYVKKTIVNKNSASNIKNDDIEYSIKRYKTMPKCLNNFYLRKNSKIEEKEITFIPLDKTKKNFFIEEKENFGKITLKIKDLRKHSNELISKNKMEMIKLEFKNTKKNVRLIFKNNSARRIKINDYSNQIYNLTI